MKVDLSKFSKKCSRLRYSNHRYVCYSTHVCYRPFCLNDGIFGFVVSDGDRLLTVPSNYFD